MDGGQALEIGAGSVFEIPPGHDKWVIGDEPWVSLDWGASGRAMEATLEEASNRSLATVMFTDIVASTATLERIGDAAWHDLLVAHNARLRVELSVFRGREVKTTGDGFLAVFDSATRAVTCAAAMIRSAKAMDLPIRVGVNTGEVEFVGDDVRGIAVHAAAFELTWPSGSGRSFLTRTRCIVSSADEPHSDCRRPDRLLRQSGRRMRLASECHAIGTPGRVAGHAPDRHRHARLRRMTVA